MKEGDFICETFLGGKYIYIYQLINFLPNDTVTVKIIYSDAVWMDGVDTMKLLITEGRKRRMKVLNADEIIFEILKNYGR